MGSRKITPQSSFENGRSSNGNGANGNNRPGGCSYLSNVRPENRSTLCSVIAQLTEETQPSFETTLRSRAVSEKCTVKFSCVVTGYPAPQMTWYKDDLQLDRYCGLPKYEIFRNGKNHSLHIYNCTEEDAAIYQASAINSKGIVSCSGVLEVGEMNEFKIHQRYFAKLKQKAENKRKEVEGKENQEPLRTISPDRAQRKRRSAMEAFISTPSSLEDEGNEESDQGVALETENGFQVTSGQDGKEPAVPVPIVNGLDSVVTNGQAISNLDNKADTSQKIPFAHQAKPPYVKKKIKISTDGKFTKPDSVKAEKITKEEFSLTAAPASSEEAKYRKNPQEVMEVETCNDSSIMDSKTKTANHKSLAKEEESLPERSLKDASIRPETSASLEKEQTPPPSKPSQLAHPGLKATGSKKAPHNVRESRHKDTNLKTNNKFAADNPKQPQGNVPLRSPNTLKLKDNAKNKNTDVDMESKATPEEPARAKDSEVVTFPPHDSRRSFPERLRDPATDQSSELKTSPGRKKVPVCQAAPPAEVTKANVKKNSNDVPISPEIKPRRKFVSQKGQQTLTERETPTGGTPSSSLHRGLKPTTDKTRKDTRDHSSKSSQSHTAHFAHLEKPTIESPAEGEKTQGCSISPKALQHQADTPMKHSEGPKIQVHEKMENKEEVMSQVQDVNATPNEQISVLETEQAVLHTAQQTQTEQTKNNNFEDATVLVSRPEMDNVKSGSKEVEGRETCDMESDKVECSFPQQQKAPEPCHPLESITESTSKKVISIAELLRSQIKALESTLINSSLITPSQSNVTHNPTSAVIGKHPDSDQNQEGETISTADRQTHMRHEEISPTSIRATLMEIFNLLNQTDQEQLLYKNAPSQPDEALPQPATIPITVPCHERTGKEQEECVMETVQEPKTSTLNSCEDSTVQKEKALDTTEIQTTSNLSESENEKCLVFQTNSEVASQESNPAVSKQTMEDNSVGSIEKLYPEHLKSQIETCSSEKTVSEISQHCKVEEPDIKTPSLLCPLNHTEQSELNTSKTDQHLLDIHREKSDTLVSLTPEPSPVLKRRSSTSPIPSATPQELATGARRKILTPKGKSEDVQEVTSPNFHQTEKKEVSTQSVTLPTPSITPSVSPSLSRKSSLLQPSGELSPAAERRSPLVSRKKTKTEAQAPKMQPDEPQTEEKPAEKTKHNPFKAPQVIRKIRGENFGDTSGHLKLWCQFFNVLSDSTIRWYRNEEEIAQTKKSAGDETQVNLAIVQASCRDSGVYGCSITNEYGSDSTDCLLSADILAGFSLREDLGIGEEIEMTPLVFSRGVADSGVWGNKLFGRIMMKETHVGNGISHKVWRAKVIYGLEPVFESGNICIIKVQNPVVYGGKEESGLIERNLEIAKQDCKIQNLAREYCKIFSAEARVIENFGRCLEVIPVYLMYRPANTIPYATVETDLTGDYQKYSVLDHTGKMEMRSGSEVEQKCCALQHWIFQWTNGNLLFTRLEGVDMKITGVGISVKSTGYQGLSVEGNPKVFELFISQHKCNYFCGLLSLRSLKVMESLMTPSKPKGSKSPLIQRKMAAGSSSPQSTRKAMGSPRMSRKSDPEDNNVAARPKTPDVPKEMNMVE